jgi:dTDP-glucose pyrophosphorylase
MKITNKKILDRIINPDFSIRDALKKMDSIGCKLLIIQDSNFTFKGLLSIGDIQRSIISNIPLEDSVSKIMRKDAKTISRNYEIDTLKKMMFERRTEFMPVIEENQLVDVVFWEDLFDENSKAVPINKFNLPVVIMAGGYGTRLKPITNVIPKPLIPIGEKTILENIFERFSRHGCDNFLLTINYKAELLKYYVNDLCLDFKIEYFEERKPLGTAGSLSLLKEHIKSTFFVTNCDILIEQDYSEILNFHLENRNVITIVGALKHQTIPYGILESGVNGKLLNIKEKPDVSYLINSGMYILEKEALDYIPEDRFFHITELINILMDENKNVGVFPVSENSWKDIGDWPEYLKNILNS